MPKDEESLCCCEYINFKGDRSHILAVCCDCDVLDESFETWLTGRSISSESSRLLSITISDRIRIPWISGKGAIKVNLDVALPVVLMPMFILLASYNIPMCIITFCTLSAFFISIHIRVFRFSPRTKFFQIWMIISICFLLYVFEVMVISYREILMEENLIWVALFLGIVYFFHKCKQDPGILATCPYPDFESQNDPQPSRVVIGSSEYVEKCNICDVWRAPRATHCRTCGVCVRRRDHHCIWLNACIGQKNHIAFLLALIFIILASSYGAHLTLTTVCTPEQIWDYFLIPVDCRYVFFDYHVAMCFTSAIYAILIAIFTSFTLLQQILLISQNLTVTEWRRAAEARRLSCCCFLVSDNPYNAGIWRNWVNFLRNVGN